MTGLLPDFLLGLKSPLQIGSLPSLCTILPLGAGGSFPTLCWDRSLLYISICIIALKRYKHSATIGDSLMLGWWKQCQEFLIKTRITQFCCSVPLRYFNNSSKTIIYCTSLLHITLVLWAFFVIKSILWQLFTFHCLTLLPMNMVYIPLAYLQCTYERFISFLSASHLNTWNHNTHR